MSNRIQFTIVLIVAQLLVSSAATSYCKDIESNSKDLQLKTHLFCDYDPDVRPHNGNATAIWFTILPKGFDFEDSSGTLTLHAWTALNWSDPFLKWKPEDFDGIDTLRVPSDEIWTPDIKVHNPTDASDHQTAIAHTLCHLTHSGGIMCIPPVTYAAQCDADYTNYPYDVQICLIQIGSWSHSTEEVLLNMSDRIVMRGYARNKEWKVIESTRTLNTEIFKLDPDSQSHMYNIKITLQRRSNGIDAIFVAPIIVLMILTLTVLWLDCYSTERLIVACISFICHLIWIQDLYYVVPHNGGSLPLILKFYENSFLLMGFSLVLTIILRDLRRTSSSVPQWLNSMTSLVLQSKVGQVLLLSILDPKASAFLETQADDNDDLVRVRSPMDKRDTTWDYVVLLIGWIAFIAVLFTYVAMLAIYLPKNIVYDEL